MGLNKSDHYLNLNMRHSLKHKKYYHLKLEKIIMASTIRIYFFKSCDWTIKHDLFIKHC